MEMYFFTFLKHLPLGHIQLHWHSWFKLHLRLVYINSLVSPCFSGITVTLPPRFWVLRSRHWFRTREGLQRKESAPKSWFWEQCCFRFSSSSHLCLAGEILCVLCDLCPAKSSVVHITVCSTFNFYVGAVVIILFVIFTLLLWLHSFN